MGGLYRLVIEEGDTKGVLGGLFRVFEMRDGESGMENCDCLISYPS